ncbi:hypothetical protein NADFUDRAFT_51502 [Nadsonia fulvescens var. elongata DSM 6958]|uniref:Actin cytoskeleton-regulatory complex protein PAN1 n=1 Tax=Nadsonia fulvescens var. elongata DSM 6958 TaxID=857566 RepID=A0A1E3PHK9_9ASCO|nr:hypothetical protein NADFUDRAFT_51502 [Nadsonia fulvescens var. elongata DSM 6958]
MYQQPQQTGHYNPPQGNTMMPQMTGYNPSFSQQQQPQQQPQQQQFSQQQLPLYVNPTGMGFGNQFAGTNQTNNAAPPIPSLPSGYLNSQATGVINMPSNIPPNMPQLTSQQTGFYKYQTPASIPAVVTASEVAPQLPNRPNNNRTNGAIDVPNVQLSFITADDQQKFSTLFRSALSPGAHALTGNQARDILVKSNLSPITLSKIWRLVDITKSGSLMFPNFALAMYLCDLAIKNKPVPASLSASVKRQVEDLIDVISFSIPEDNATGSGIGAKTDGVPDFTIGASANPIMAQPTGVPYQFASDQGLLSQFTGGQGLQSKSTDYQPQQPIQSQSTGYQHQQPIQSQLTGGQTLQSQLTGGQALQSQLTGYQPQQPIQSQSTGYQHQQPIQPQLTGGQALQSQLTGGQSLQSQFTGGQSLQSQLTGGQSLQSQPTGYLQSQPTGKPGQWGFINTPSSGLPGIDLLRSQFMPQMTGAANTTPHSIQQLQGNATVEWAITKDEKKIYDDIFRAWDQTRRGFIDGESAIKIFSQSGLNRSDLEVIWNLSDPSNKGKLDKDEFAVAMHLIYRHLNGYPIPARLPAELIPPSSRNFSESINKIKSYLKNDPSGSSVSSLSTQKTGGSVSYLKNRSFTGTNENAFKKDATVFKNNDNEVSYVSKARHKSRHKSDSNDEKVSASSSLMSITDLKKAIHEKQILLDAIDARDDQDNADMSLEKAARDAIDQLRHRIRNMQNDINRQAPSSTQSNPGLDSRQLLKKLQVLADRLPQLTSSVQKTEDEIARAKLTLFRLQAEKEHPGITIVGTGPDGSVTESDRRKAKQKALLQNRMAALTGKISTITDFEDFESRYAAEESRVLQECQTNLSMISDVETGVSQMKASVESVLRNSSADIQSERDHRRWIEAVGVEDEVREFISSLESSRPVESNVNNMPSSLTNKVDPSSLHIDKPRVASPVNSSIASNFNKSVEDAATRSARIKAMAVKRMNEKLAKLGISRTSKSSNAFAAPGQSDVPAVQSQTSMVSPSPAASPVSYNTPPQVVSRARRPPASSPAPVATPSPAPVATPSPAPVATPSPAPVAMPSAPAVMLSPAPVAPVDSETDSSDSDSDDEEYKALLEQKRAEEERIRQMELEQKRKAALKEEKKRAKKEALKTEMAAIKARETAMLASQSNNSDHNDNDDSDRESYEFVESVTVSGQPNASDTSSTNNPFYKPLKAPIAAPVPTHAAVPSLVSAPITTNHTDSNPFHQQQKSNGQLNTPRVSESSTPVIDAKEAVIQRAMQRGQAPDNDDDWGKSTDDDDDSSDDDAVSSGRVNSANLASMLFRGMAPQRTGSNLSTMESTPAPTISPAIPTSEYSTPQVSSSPATVVESAPTQEPMAPANAPPPPPMPNFPNSAPPPPPMPIFPTGAPPPPPPPTGAPPPPTGAPPPPTGAPPVPAMSGINQLLGEIQAGRSLRKVDDSQKHVSENIIAGRVI